MTQQEFNLCLQAVIVANFNKNELLWLEPEIQAHDRSFMFDNYPSEFRLMVIELIKYADRNNKLKYLTDIIAANISKDKPPYHKQFIAEAKKRNYTYWKGVEK